MTNLEIDVSAPQVPVEAVTAYWRGVQRSWSELPDTATSNERVAFGLAAAAATLLSADRERIAVAIEAVAASDDYVWVSARQTLNHAATIARSGS